MEQHLKILVNENEESSEATRLALKGQFTWLHGRTFRVEVEKALEMEPVLIELDFTELYYVDSTALSEVVRAHKDAERVGKNLKIVNPRKLIRHIFVSSNLDKVIEIGPAIAN